MGFILGILFGTFLAMYHIKKFEWFKSITYALIALKYQTRNILVCEYIKGFDYRYKKRKYCYLIAQEKQIILHPINTYAKNSIIPYDKIIEVIVVRNPNSVKNNSMLYNTHNTEDFPNRISHYVSSIIVKYIAANDIEDLLQVEVESVGRYFEGVWFNDYSMKKSNFFESLAINLSNNIIKQEIFNTQKH